jgi:hypothetical protein
MEILEEVAGSNRVASVQQVEAVGKAALVNGASNIRALGTGATDRCQTSQAALLHMLLVGQGGVES